MVVNGGGEGERLNEGRIMPQLSLNTRPQNDIMEHVAFWDKHLIWYYCGWYLRPLPSKIYRQNTAYLSLSRLASPDDDRRPRWFPEGFVIAPPEFIGIF